MVPSNTSAVNAKVSPSVGCGWTVSDISSASEPISIASIPSEIRSPAEGPTIPTPKTVLDSSSNRILVLPWLAPTAIARPLAAVSYTHLTLPTKRIV